jgi:PadR family transcriptional regulator
MMAVSYRSSEPMANRLLTLKLYIYRNTLMSRTPNISRQTLNLLATLLNAPEAWRHGYDLSKETGLKSGTLYPILMRLSDQGLLESRWEEPEQRGRPPRHIYRLTPNGRAFARERIAARPATAALLGAPA